MRLQNIEVEQVGTAPLAPGSHDELLTVKLRVVGSAQQLHKVTSLDLRELGERLVNVLGDSSYVQSAVIELRPVDVERVRRWLLSPSGALTTDTDMRHHPRRGLVLNAVEDGSIWVRVVPR